MKIKALISSRIPKTARFFSTFPWKNVLSFLFFLLLAFVFWLMLFFQKGHVESSYTIPLKYTHVPEDVVFDRPLPEQIEVSVTDDGGEIFLLDLKKRDSLEIDVEEITKGGNNILQGDQYLQMIRSKFSASTTIRGYFPMNISLASSKLQKKNLRVTFDGEIITGRTNLVADSATFIPETVTAYGSQRSLDQLQSAMTQYTVLKNIKATSQFPIKLRPEEGIKFSPNEVEMYIPIKEYTEQMFEIAITASKVPDNLDVKFFPSRANISFSVTLDAYKKISPEDFEIELNYRNFHQNENGRVDLAVTRKPASVTNIRLSPSSVEFLFEDKHH